MKERIDMINRAIVGILTFVLLLSYFAPAASAESGPVFTLTASEDRAVAGRDIRVIVTGEHLQDMYGFEIQLTYDKSRLEYKGAKSAVSGFSVPVHEEEGRLLFAHTKVGRTNGESGKVEMAEITFRMIAAGKTSVELKKVKLVSSDIMAQEPKADVRIDFDITRQLQAFTDISGHWAEGNIDKAASIGIVDGYPDGTFRPQQFVTRAEFTAMLIRALSLPQATDIALEFTDSPHIPSWAVPAVSQAISAGIVTGYEDHTFRASKHINRAEMAVMATRTLGVPIDSGKTTSFADDSEIPSWASPFIAHAVEVGIMQGRGNNRFVPKANATRAEAVTLILTLQSSVNALF
jgi:hypothetical protein